MSPGHDDKLLNYYPFGGFVMNRSEIIIIPLLSYWVVYVNTPGGLKYTADYMQEPTEEEVRADWKNPQTKKGFRVVG